MKLLYINCCISSHDVSRTQLLADTFLDAWQEYHEGDEIEVLDLRQMALFPLLQDSLSAHEAAQAAENPDAPEFALARQFASADRIVIAAPFWELSYPAQLRLYIEHIAASGITFGYTKQGQVGLCRAEKLLFLTTAGGPLKDRNCGSDHWRALCPFFGIAEYHFIGAAMQDVQEMDHGTLLENALQQAIALAKTF